MVRGAFKNMPSALNFGLIDPEAKGASQTVSIMRGDGGPIAPKVGQSQVPGLTAEIKEVVAGEHYEMTVRLAAPLALGAINGLLMLETGIPESLHESVRVIGTVTKRMQVVPEELRLPAKTTRETDRSMVVMWHTTTGNKIISASSSDPKLEAKVMIQGRSQEVHVKVPDGYELTVPWPTITIKTDDPERAEIKVPVVLDTPKPAPQVPNKKAP